METILLRYRTRRGEDILRLEPEITAIDLSYRHITSIDLAPLARCTELRSLDLSNNSLTQIDLWPLIRCKRLSSLNLINNPLTELDVTPLFSCPHLSTIEVDPAVVIRADYEIGTSGPRPRPLDGLRRRRAVHWTRTPEEMDPQRVVENIKNRIYAELADLYPSPDNAHIVDETLRFRLCEKVEKAFIEEIREAEERGDFRRLFTLERGLEYLRERMSLM